MSETDVIVVDAPLPRIGSVRPAGTHSVTVSWVGQERIETVDLAPQILTYKIYRPLREDPRLFATVHVVGDGAAIAWGADDVIDMSAATIERLASEVMTNHDFAAFLQRTNLSLNAAAAELGISRRLVAYYAKDRPVPRYIALACHYIEEQIARRNREDMSAVRIVEPL
jgi:hypothetical protein